MKSSRNNILDRTISLKKCIFSVILAVVSTSVIGVTAITLGSNKILFTPSNADWKVDNVEDAMNDLYTLGNDKVSENYTNGYNEGYNKGIESGAKVIYLGKGSSINVSSKCNEYGIDYTKLTSSNFIVSASLASSSAGYTNSSTDTKTVDLFGFTPTISYNASSAVVSVSPTSTRARAFNSSWRVELASTTAAITYDVYLVTSILK